MTSRTRWNRLSPDPRNVTMRRGLRAQLADPLWLLGRQWQVGELTGEDAGSPVAAELWVDHDPMTALERSGDAVEAYDPTSDPPLETLVEAEPVLTDTERQPNREDAVEAGRYFLAVLDEEGVTVDGRPPRPSDFPQLQLDPPDREVDSTGDRYMAVVEDRSLDGSALFDRLTGDASMLSADDWQGVSWRSVELPAALGSSDGVRRAAKAFVDWYADLYDEPADETAATAWNTDRLEYEFRAATGEGDGETVFSVEEYPGGRLDWDAFWTVGDGDASLTDALDGATGESFSVDLPGVGGVGGTLPDAAGGRRPESAPDTAVAPTNVSFPGMPSTRWWELEDGGVNLGDMTVGPGELGKLLLTEHATLYGNDWFSIPLEAPVGSLTRITEFLVTDTFGEVTRVEPVVRTDGDATSAADVDVGDEAAEDPTTAALSDSGGWNMFMHTGLPNHDRPGLLLPPALGAHHESDPVERVVFARDELANMAFGIELVTEDAVGDPLEWGEFSRPTLSVDTVRGADSPADERLRLTNPGERPLDVGGWTVDNGAGDSYTIPEGTVVGPDEFLTIYSGPGADVVAGELYWGRTSQPVWRDADEVLVDDDDGDRVVRAFIGEPANPSFPDYRLVTDVHEHWFPLRMLSAGERGAGEFAIGDLRFELATLLDADLEGHRPAGEVLSPDLLLHDEELTRAGVEVTRNYQYTRWLNGGVHLWSGRRAGPGRGEGSSGLQYDVLVEPEPEDAGSEES